jgi:type II secretory pathway pseudopilin PulG
VEVLIGLAITAMVSVSLVSALLSIAAAGRREAAQTDQYESLRLAAQMIITDARYAEKVEGQWDYLLLTYTTGRRVRYIFATYDTTNPNAPQADPNNLHRWDDDGKGGPVRDQILARDLATPQYGDETTTSFDVNSTAPNRYAHGVLIKVPLKGQGQDKAVRLEFTTLLR